MWIVTKIFADNIFLSVFNYIWLCFSKTVLTSYSWYFIVKAKKNFYRIIKVSKCMSRMIFCNKHSSSIFLSDQLSSLNPLDTPKIWIKSNRYLVEIVRPYLKYHLQMTFVLQKFDKTVSSR